MGPNNRPALTLLECLIVVAMLVVAAAILLPVIQKMRIYAARARCIDQCRQIGAAFLRFHDTHEMLPQGGDNGPDGPPARLDRRDEWSWAYHLLPHLDQADLHRADPAVIDTTPVRAFYCPGRRSPGLHGGSANLDYAGNAGTSPDGINGTILQGSVPKIAFRDIADGLAATVLMAERQLNTASLGVSLDDQQPYNRAGWDENAQAYRLALERPAPDPHRPDDPAASSRFGSSHRHGFNAVFADGSARLVSFGVSPAVWRRACVRDDMVEQPDPNNY